MRWTDACRWQILTFALALLLSACNKNDHLPPPPPAGRLSIAGPSSAIPGDTMQFTSTYVLDGRATDVTRAATWSSSNPSVLSVTSGLATAHAVGVAVLTVEYEQARTTRPVPVVGNAGWDGAYTLTVRGINCTSMMPAALKQRTYPATAVQRGAYLEVTVLKGHFFGQILASGVRFELLDYSYYGYYGPSVWEFLPDGNLLVVAGTVSAPSSPSGFAGTLSFGKFTLYPPEGPRSIYPLDMSNAIATCDSDAFSLTR